MSAQETIATTQASLEEETATRASKEKELASTQDTLASVSANLEQETTARQLKEKEITDLEQEVSTAQATLTSMQTNLEQEMNTREEKEQELEQVKCERNARVLKRASERLVRRYISEAFFCWVTYVEETLQQRVKLQVPAMHTFVRVRFSVRARLAILCVVAYVHACLCVRTCVCTQIQSWTSVLEESVESQATALEASAATITELRKEFEETEKREEEKAMIAFTAAHVGGSKPPGDFEGISRS